MTPQDFHRIQSRRSFFRYCAGGLETIALSQMLQQDGYAADKTNPLAPRPPHFPGKAKNIIVLFMEGAPSQMDLFDPKPALQKYHGQSLPESMTKDLKLAFIKPTAAVLASPRKFTPYGQSGMEMSDYIPNIASCADDICLVRSMYTEAFNHHPGQLLLFTGSVQFGRPTAELRSMVGLYFGASFLQPLRVSHRGSRRGRSWRGGHSRRARSNRYRANAQRRRLRRRFRGTTEQQQHRTLCKNSPHGACLPY